MQNRCISDGISFLSDEGRLAVSGQIRSEYWPHIRAKGYFIVVKPYIRPSKVGDVMVPESMRFEDQHHSVIAQVIDIGPVAYTENCGGVSWAEIGDWVIIPRVAGVRSAMKIGDTDVMLRIIKEDDIVAVVSDPTEWEIRISSTKF